MMMMMMILEDRAHDRVNPYPGACRQNETEMLSDHDKTSPLIAAVSADHVDLFCNNGSYR